MTQREGNGAKPGVFTATAGWLSRLRTGATQGAAIPSYPQPKTAVLAMDLQRDFLEEGGRMRIEAAQVDEVVRASNTVLAAARRRGLPVVYVGNEFPPTDVLANLARRGAAVQGSRGAEIDPRIDHLDGAYFPKRSRDAFSNPELDAYLRQNEVAELIVVGVFAGACVRATVLGALNRGYRVVVVREGLGAASMRERESVLAEFTGAGVRVEGAESYAGS
jgi:nicotinamidase-related amidase